MKNIVVTCALIICVLMTGGPARGDVLTASEANVIISSTAFDQDLLYTSFTESDNAVADFNGILNNAGWSGLLTGNFLGTALNVSYSSDSSAFSTSGAITWNSSGSYGSSAWAGSGAATFTSIDLNNITATYVSTLTIGADVISFTDSIAGSGNGTTGLSVSADGIASLTISPHPPVNVGTLFVVERDTEQQNLYASILRGPTFVVTPESRRLARIRDSAELKRLEQYHAQFASIPPQSS
jgi:hypothetical protein